MNFEKISALMLCGKQFITYLLGNSNVYKNENIKLNTDWLNTISHDSSSFVKEVEVFDPFSEYLNDDCPTNIVTDAHSPKKLVLM